MRTRWRWTTTSRVGRRSTSGGSTVPEAPVGSGGDVDKAREFERSGRRARGVAGLKLGGEVGGGVGRRALGSIATLLLGALFGQLLTRLGLGLGRLRGDAAVGARGLGRGEGGPAHLLHLGDRRFRIVRHGVGID